MVRTPEDEKQVSCESLFGLGCSVARRDPWLLRRVISGGVLCFDHRGGVPVQGVHCSAITSA
jgi:hypothetical protein